MRAILILCVLGWIAWLGGLAVETANPVTLNRAQILAADVIVEGRWTDAARGKLAVDRVWKRPAVAGEITIRELPRFGVPGEGKVLLPLTQIAKSEFRITGGEVPNPPEFGGRQALFPSHVAPIGYPATDATIQAMEQFLAE